MTTRIERQTVPHGRVAQPRRRNGFAPLEQQYDPHFALAYSNGCVTVEISQAALDAFIDMTGDVPLPIVRDVQTGDRRTYDARNKVRVVYDAATRLREISTSSVDGFYVRINFAAAAEARGR